MPLQLGASLWKREVGGGGTSVQGMPLEGEKETQKTLQWTNAGADPTARRKNWMDGCCCWITAIKPDHTT
jgi:hypothetical protein